MNQEGCLEIVRASTWARTDVIIQQGKSPSEGKIYKHERQTEITRSPNF